ncbi:MAG TPA: TetR/AcrR family transcriptional regulator [Tissierellia bacterium]|nr:TetR/AcrR family transcriptional regulator [Tissierellia bacterium]
MPRVSQKYIENRKKMIVISARQVFARKGYVSASMKDIMSEATISRGGLYAYFQNIDSIFIEVLKYDDSLQANRLINSDLNKPLLPQLFDWIREIVQSSQTTETNLIRARSEFFLAHDVEDVPYLRERHENLSQHIQEFIAAGVKTGEFKGQLDVNSFSGLLISMIDGILLHQHYQYAADTKLIPIMSLMNHMIENTLT